MEEIISIYAAEKGYLDQIPVHHISDFEHKILHHFKIHHGKWLVDLNKSGVLSADQQQTLDTFLTDFLTDYVTELPLSA